MARMRQPSGAILLAVLIVPLGIASLWASHGPARAAEFAPWLAAGWACVAGGLAARRTAPWSRVWLLLLAVGITWLVPDLSNCLNVEPLSHRCIPVNAAPWLVGAADWVWLGLAGHAVIAFPDGRLTRGPLVAAVIAAYVLTLGVAFDAGPTRPLLAALLVGAPIAASASAATAMSQRGLRHRWLVPPSEPPSSSKRALPSRWRPVSSVPRLPCSRVLPWWP